jgi:ADP-ribose pyrophosphatase
VTGFERTGGDEVWSGKIASVHVDRFRYDDGDEKEREIIRHPGAVVVLAHDDDHLYLVTQPREAVGDPALLELPAGKLDEEGEEPLDTAKRELAEEIGKGARDWRPVTTFFSSPGILDEEVHLFIATGLYDERAEAEDTARIEVDRVPLADLDDAIRRCHDAKSLVGLLWLKAYGPG